MTPGDGEAFGGWVMLRASEKPEVAAAIEEASGFADYCTPAGLSQEAAAARWLTCFGVWVWMLAEEHVRAGLAR